MTSIYRVFSKKWKKLLSVRKIKVQYFDMVQKHKKCNGGLKIGLKKWRKIQF